ncbi:MAG: hypothetical protein ACFFEN_05420, partial [Candidatus Thorarchaeota archaeon]
MDIAESLKKKEELIIHEDIHEKERKKRIKIDWGRQGGVIFGYVVVLLGYYGIIVNMTLFNQCNQHWISFTDSQAVYWLEYHSAISLRFG